MLITEMLRPCFCCMTSPTNLLSTTSGPGSLRFMSMPRGTW
uniref:Alternative protein RAB37 n=1 Tax=Homo sapiens TaxID=9606 RepID=L8EBG4_HUMAN|nr:alternative protein RAB37 [Homo sapiens]